MKKILYFLGILLAIVVYFLWFRGDDEAYFRNHAPMLRAEACRTNPVIDVALIGPPDVMDPMSVGASMVFAEANNRVNPDDSRGVQVLDENGELTAKTVRCRTYTYTTPEEALDMARSLTRKLDMSAVIGHYSSDVAYPASLIYQEGGLLYLCPFATSSRITRHHWPTVIRVVPPVQEFMSAILEHLSAILGSDTGTKKIALFHTDTLYSEDAVTALHNYIADNKRLVNLIDRGREMMETGTLSPDSLLYRWLEIPLDARRSMQDEIDVTDKLFITQKLAHFGFTATGIRAEDLDIQSLRDNIDVLFRNDITVGEAIEHLANLTPDVELVHVGRYRQGTTDFGEHIRLLPKTNTDIILLLDTVNETSLELIQELRESGISQPIIGDDSIDYPLVIEEFLGDEAGDIFIVNGYDDRRHGEFLERKFQAVSADLPADMRERFRPSYQTFQGYRAASLFVQAVRESESSDPAIVATRLKHKTGEGWNSMSGGAIHFDSRGDILQPEFILKKYDNGTFTGMAMNKKGNAQ